MNESRPPRVEPAGAPRLEGIFIAPSAGAGMIRVKTTRAMPGVGLEGDRYALGTGYYSKVDPCEVTLIEAETLDIITQRFGIAIDRGEHRRNLVTRGLRLSTLAGRRFQIGAVLLEYDRPRPPCAY